MNLTQTTLDNGLQVILHETHVAPVASFWIYYKVGSRNEGPGLTGVSHWVEHMLFKGTERFPAGEFDKAVARAGGLFNGMTSQDWTTYFETFPSDRIDLALEVESDRMVNSIFDPEETESERTVILSEREGSENSYFWLLNEEVQAAAFHVHPYRHPIIGWKEDLHSIQREDLFLHYQTYYTAGNAVAVACGDFATDDMLGRIGERFGALSPGPAIPPVRGVEPVQQAERRVMLRGADPTGYLILSFPAPPAQHPDFFPLVVLDSILSGAKGMGLLGGSTNNRSNRLYQALVDTGLAVSADTSFRPTIDPGQFSFYVTLAPDVEHAPIEERIWSEVGRIQAEGVRGDELEKAIKQTRTQFAFSNESVTYQAYWLGFSAVVAGVDWLLNWTDTLTAVTSEDVRRVAATYLRRDAATIGQYHPDPEKIAMLTGQAGSEGGNA